MKTNKILPVLSKTLFGVIFFSGSLLAAEGEEQSDPVRISVGDRAMSHVERVQIQEERAQRAQRLAKGEDITDEEQLELTEAEEQELAGNQDQASGSEEEQENVAASKLMKKGMDATIYYTTHEGAFHHPLAVSLLGDTVELEDGSIWAVSSGDRYKTLDWMTGDVIIIKPNHCWLSSYDYRLVNINTDASVKVNLSLGPIYNGVFTHWVIAIDYCHREIRLEDGSVWKISSFDNSVMQKWLPNDTVIIGINDGWFSGSNPNILINVNMNNYAIGNCLN
ncbi:MAG: hypothetical protein ACE5GN_01145 [Waddliaceae bacterium]